MKRFLIVCLVAVLLGCSSCSRQVSADIWAMDTYMHITLWGEDAQTAAENVSQLLRDMERDWSATDGNSVIGRLSRGQEVALTDDQAAFLAEVEALSQLAGGAFDPQLGVLTALWRQGRVPDAQALAAARERRQWDLGAAVKGYAGRQAAVLLQETGVSHGILNLGGNVQTFGQKPDGTPWQIAMQSPSGEGTVGMIAVTGTMAVVTSGDYQRYFEENGVRYHHILNPQTGYPAESGLTAVTVICTDGLKADVYSTALFVMGMEQAADFWRAQQDFEAVFLLKSGKIYATEGVSLSGCQYEVISSEK